MMNRNTKLFVQLRPDDESLAAIIAFQQEIPVSANIIDKETLHMTIIHIGKASRILNSLRGITSLPDKQILKNLDELGRIYEKEINSLVNPTYLLKQKAFSHFGNDHQTLVMEFVSTPELDALHAICLNYLKIFLVKCGVRDIEAFMQRDKNLQHALSLRPHVTIAKQSSDIPPQHAHPDEYTFIPMPVFYSN